MLDAGHDPQRDVGRAAVREGVLVGNVEPAGGRPLTHLELDLVLGMAVTWVTGTDEHFCQFAKLPPVGVGCSKPQLNAIFQTFGIDISYTSTSSSS